MAFAPSLPDFRVAVGYFLMCAAFFLFGCSDSAQRSGSPAASPSDGPLRFSATLSYEDRQMMRRYLVQGVHDGIAAMAEMQEKIDRSHDDTCQ